MAKKAASNSTTKQTPTGPHTPISNVAPEVAAAAGKLVSLPETGEAKGVLKPRDNGTEMLRPERVSESTEVLEAPAAEHLRDIGAASFKDPAIVLETVHGPDNRLQVQDTDKYPYRLNASLLITARDGSQWIGTGWFISNRTLITAGHCVCIKNSGVPNRDGWVKTIQVMRNTRSHP